MNVDFDHFKSVNLLNLIGNHVNAKNQAAHTCGEKCHSLTSGSMLLVKNFYQSQGYCQILSTVKMNTAWFNI